MKMLWICLRKNSYSCHTPLDSIKTFDNIIVFQDGRIVEQGRFDELIEKRQYFYELYKRTMA